MSQHGTRDSTRFCRHYDGSKLLQPRSAGLCRLGADVPALVGEPRAGWLLRAPCNHKNECATPCGQFSGFTPEESIQRQADMEAAMERAISLTPLIAELKAKHPKGWADVTVCPFCAGKFSFSIAKSNGHFHGRCETPNCINVME